MKKNKIAIFDLDGTLFNTNDVNYHSYQNALAQYGIDLDYEYFCKECNGRSYKYFLPILLKDTNEDKIKKIHEFKINDYEKNLKYAKINFHLFSIIELIKSDYIIALVTTASKKNTYDILNYFDKIVLFDDIVTHEDVVNVKPDPEGFMKIINKYGSDVSTVVIFEDSIVGIEAANKTGATVFKVEKF